MAAEPGPRTIRAGLPRERIDDAILPRLTAEDLKELGDSSLGHRHKLLDAIAALHTDGSGTGTSAAAEATPATLAPIPKNALSAAK